MNKKNPSAVRIVAYDKYKIAVMKLRMLFTILPLLLLAGLLSLLWCGLGLNLRVLPSALIGQPVPAFQLPNLQNTHNTLNSDKLRGHWSLLNVWASWCSGCRQEHPLLMHLNAATTAPLYGLNWKDNATAARQWLQQHGNPYQNSGFDPSGATGIDLGVYGVPETFLIDPQGIIRYRHSGPLTTAIWQRYFKPWLDQSKSIGPKTRAQYPQNH